MLGKQTKPIGRKEAQKARKKNAFCVFCAFSRPLLLLGSLNNSFLTTDYTDCTDTDSGYVGFHPCYPCNPWLIKHFLNRRGIFQSALSVAAAPRWVIRGSPPSVLTPPKKPFLSTDDTDGHRCQSAAGFYLCESVSSVDNIVFSSVAAQPRWVIRGSKERCALRNEL